MDAKWLQTMQIIVKIQQHNVFFEVEGLESPQLLPRDKRSKKTGFNMKNVVEGASEFLVKLAEEKESVLYVSWNVSRRCSN